MVKILLLCSLFAFPVSAQAANTTFNGNIDYTVEILCTDTFTGKPCRDAYHPNITSDYKYLVTWELVERSCLSYINVPDKFGRSSQSFESTCIIVERSRSQNSKEFYLYHDALEFYNECNSSIKGILGNGLENCKIFVIEEIKP